MKLFEVNSENNSKVIKNKSLSLATWLVVAILFWPYSSISQADSTKVVPDGTEGQILTVSPDDYLKKQLPFNEFNGTYSTFKIGLGYILDAATFRLNDVFKQQMDSAGLSFDPGVEVRDFRILASGVLKTKRMIAWKFAYMYDGNEKIWMMRETGLTIGVPELFGHLFIGRTKEGYSLVKVMNAHSAWTAERQMALDVIPILADGIKWLGYLPKQKVFWNLGFYHDFISKGQSFSTYTWQTALRAGWMPYYNKEKNKVVHVAANIRYGHPDDGQITLRSRPESNLAPQIINTGTFKADYSSHFGAELYYSSGRLLAGSELMLHSFYAREFEDHHFFGGDVMVSYLFTKTTRPYTTVGSIFGFVPVKKSVFNGGWGEWEAVLRFSSLDLDNGSIHGGKFWRITPMINWYMARMIRFELIYGYGVLDRYHLKGNVQFFQTRLQLSVL